MDTIQQQQPMWKPAMSTGLVLGLVLMIVSLIQNVMEMFGSVVFQYLSYIILIAGLILSIKYYRDQVQNGFISYGQVVGFGVLTALFAGIISAFLMFLYLKFVDGSMIAYIFDKTEQDLYSKNMSDEQIDSTLAAMKNFTNPGMIAVLAVISNVFFGLIVSLIAGIFMKNEQDELPNM